MLIHICYKLGQILLHSPASNNFITIALHHQMSMTAEKQDIVEKLLTYLDSLSKIHCIVNNLLVLVAPPGDTLEPKVETSSYHYSS